MEASDIPEPTKERPGDIKPIDESAVHRICSGQVVLTLAIAVKELVENALDAGATLVEVKLQEQGLESIEVSDNGTGVAEVDLQNMTAKYHTSKLEKFVDLISVETFGFRGEALSSLCVLSNMTIITRHKSSDVATKIELDHEGNIAKRSSCSRSVGTTVTLTKLFETLPVRRREFTYNIKREFTKMCNLLQAYCLVAKGVRLICTNHTAKSGRTVIMQTHGAQTTLENISAIFGVRQSNELVALKPAFENLEKLTKERFLEELTLVDSKVDSLKISDDDIAHIKTGHFRFEGYVSSCSHGSGRSSKDRQFFYINSRPCDSKHLPKVFDEIYHRYNMHQHPFVFLNVFSDRAEVDVNVTPDKRLLLIRNEKILFLLLKRALLNTYDNIAGHHKMQNVSITSIFKVGNKTESSEVKIEKNPPKNKDSSSEEEGLIPLSSAKKFMDVLSQWRRTGDTRGPAPPTRVTGTKRKCTNEIEERTKKMKKIQAYLTQELPKSIESGTFASYKSESESDNEETNKSLNDSSSDKSFPSIEKINKASKEYDLITSTAIERRIDCKVAGPAKSFLTFVNRSKKYDPREESISNSQESTILKEIEDSPSTSNSVKSLESKVIATSKAFSMFENQKPKKYESDEDTLLNSQKARISAKAEDAQSTSTSFNSSELQANKLSEYKYFGIKKSIPTFERQSSKEYDSEGDSFSNTQESTILNDMENGSSTSTFAKSSRSKVNILSDYEFIGSQKSFPTFEWEKAKNYDSEEDSLCNTQESMILNDMEDGPSTSTSAKSNGSHINTFSVFENRKIKKYGSDRDSPPNTQEFSTLTEAEDEPLKPISIEPSDSRVNEFSEEKEEESKYLNSDDSDDSNFDTSVQQSLLKAIELDDDNNEAEPEIEQLVGAVVKTSLEEIAAGMEAERKYKEKQRANNKLKRLRFKCEINPSENKRAEEELNAEISKSDFARMEIIGQFNLGFIIVKLDDDLFIVDQHASDEKYNFEKLQETTVLESQRLTVPQPLSLTVVNEMVLLDHLPVFEKNGFKFEIDENAPPMHKVKLVAKPISKNWEFGKEDIDELIFMLQDAPKGTMCRPSRVRDMFASRACRKSVMIGTALEESAMKKLITNMGEIQQPWNCPHGRPTIRHLINLAMLATDSDEESNTSSEDNINAADNDAT